MSLFSFCENVNVFSLKFLYWAILRFLFTAILEKEKKKNIVTWKPYCSHLDTKLWLFQLSLVIFRLLKNCEVMINRMFELTIILIDIESPIFNRVPTHRCSWKWTWISCCYTKMAVRFNSMVKIVKSMYNLGRSISYQRLWLITA